MLEIAWAIKPTRSPSSEGVRKIPGYPDKVQVHAENIKLIQISHLSILRVYWQHL